MGIDINKVPRKLSDTSYGLMAMVGGYLGSSQKQEKKLSEKMCENIDPDSEDSEYMCPVT